MLNIINKPADHIDVGDIHELVTSQVPEGQQLEFKKTLPGDGKIPDPWLSRQNRIDNRSRNELLEEVVAFANAQGGLLLVGISESQDKPPVADKIIPLPKCAELADRLRKMLRDCVEPQVPLLEVFGVPVEEDAGVVVVRVGQSRLAPHRVIPTKICPIRRADRCESMNMWEIQDMTLNVSRGMERFEKRLQERSKRFQQVLNRLKTPNESFALRFTALPVGEDIMFDRVYRQNNIREDLLTTWRGVCYKGRKRTLDSQIELPPEPDSWRPVLRGARGEKHGIPVKNYYFGYQELYCDGLLEMGYVSCNSEQTTKPLNLHPDWPFVLFANFIVWADHVRKESSSPMAEYGIQVEVLQQGRKVRLANDFDKMTAVEMDALMRAQDEINLDKKFPEITNITFPTYELGHEESPKDMLNTFFNDFYDWLGINKDENIELLILET